MVRPAGLSKCIALKSTLSLLTIRPLPFFHTFNEVVMYVVLGGLSKWHDLSWNKTGTAHVACLDRVTMLPHQDEHPKGRDPIAKKC